MGVSHSDLAFIFSLWAPGNLYKLTQNQLLVSPIHVHTHARTRARAHTHTHTHTHTSTRNPKYVGEPSCQPVGIVQDTILNTALTPMNIIIATMNLQIWRQMAKFYVKGVSSPQGQEARLYE